MGYKSLEFNKESVFLVTGVAGFIGSNLAEAILSLGYKVVGLDNLSTGFMSNLDSIIKNNRFNFIEGDICDLDTCISASKGVDYVLHQAAWGSVPRSIEMPLFYEEVNIKGSLNMLEASRINNIKKYVYASSSSVYGDSPELPKREGIEGNVLSPYALTKKVNEEFAKLYNSLYKLETVGLRYFNVFGKHQNPDGAYAAVIPKFVKLLANGERPIINGDGSQSRDFTYIENVIEANLKACLSNKANGKAYNIAYGGQVTLIELYNHICDLTDIRLDPIFGPERLGDIKHSNANIENAKLDLNYSPDYSYYDGIELTIEWYMKQFL